MYIHRCVLHVTVSLGFLSFIALCQTLPNITGGTLTFDTDNLNKKAVYTCDVGYTIDGVSEIECDEDGTWGTLPDCGRSLS